MKLGQICHSLKKSQGFVTARSVRSRAMHLQARRQNRSYLCGFQSLLPASLLTQRQTLDWLAMAHAKSEETSQKKRSADFNFDQFHQKMTHVLQRFGCSPEHIQYRLGCLNDFLHLEFDKMQIFNLTENEKGAGMGARTQVFSQKVDAIFEEFYRDTENPPKHILHVTCTGYASPSGAQKLLNLRKWNTKTQVLHLYHMGCYAAMPAVRVADALATDVDIVHTEMCTLHLNPADHSPEQLVVQSLFADGFIRYQVTDTRPTKNQCLEILTSSEEIILNSTDAITWICSEWGFQMQLSRQVPKIIAGHVELFLERMFESIGLQYSSERAQAVFAIHPGGPKIIEELGALLQLNELQTSASRAVLFERGNMSSATIPHVWKKIVEDDTVAINTLIVSLAFGPGLTISGNILRKI